MPPRKRGYVRARVGPAIFLPLGIWLASPSPTAAQEAVLRIEENFRVEPNGAVLGRLYPGTRVTVAGVEGDWTRATIEGFVWLASLQARESGSFDLTVSLAGGENLREEPAGRVGGRLVEGTLLEEVDRITGWARVRRTAWIWSASLEGATTTPAGGAAATAALSGGPAGAGPSAGIGPDVPPSTRDGWLRSGDLGGPILAAPDGDTLGRVQPGSEVRVLSTEGNWARVQIEGWVWLPAFSAQSGPAAADAPVLEGVRARDLSSDFARLRGRLVRLDLQFISVERAEQVRTDFYEGEPFLLARSFDEDRAFVYVAVPPERLAAMGLLTPLERIRVLGRLRSGGAAFTGSPILDLVELERVR